MKEPRYKKGDTVYVNSDAFIAEECKVLDLIERSVGLKLDVYNLYSESLATVFGTTEDYIFSTKEEAIKNSVKSNYKKMQQKYNFFAKSL